MLCRTAQILPWSPHGDGPYLSISRIFGGQVLLHRNYNTSIPVLRNRALSHSIPVLPYIYIAWILSYGHDVTKPQKRQARSLPDQSQLHLPPCDTTFTIFVVNRVQSDIEHIDRL